MIQSKDPLYQQVADIRMVVYGTSDLWFGYFSLRKVKWFGDKAAIRYLSEYDSEFLMAFKQFVDSNQGRLEKFEAYERAASLVTATHGGIWPEDATVMNLERASGLWEKLLDVNEKGKS
jgi:hypothetical protein